MADEDGRLLARRLQRSPAALERSAAVPPAPAAQPSAEEAPAAASCLAGVAAAQPGLWRFFVAALPEAPAPSAPPLGGNEDPVIESAALLELAGFVDHPELPSDYNLSWFFKWLAGQHCTRATVFAKGITVTMHRLADGTAQPIQAGIDATKEGAERFGSLWREMLAKRLGLEWRSAPSGRDLLGDCVNARPSHLRPSDLADRVWKELDLLSAASTSSPPLALLLRTATRKTPAADATACTEPGQQPASSPSAAVPWDDGDFDQDPLVTVGNRLLAHVPVDPWADRSIVGLDDGVPAASLADADIFPREPLAAMVLSPAAPSTASRPP